MHLGNFLSGFWVSFLDFLSECRYGIGAVAASIAPVANEAALKKLKDGLTPPTVPEESNVVTSFDIGKEKSTVTITVVGASGDLAKKKIFPALFALYYEGCLPEVCNFSIMSVTIINMYDA